MPSLRLPFGEWKPDMGEWEHDGLFRVKGAVHNGGVWRPAPAIYQLGDGGNLNTGTAALGAYASKDLVNMRGFHIHIEPEDNNGRKVRYIVGAGGANPYIVVSDYNYFESFDFGTTTSVTPDDVSGFQFVSYGNYVYVACGTGNKLKRIDIALTTIGDGNNTTSGGTNIYDPRARYITAYKNHIFLGYVGYNAVPTGSTLTAMTAGTPVYPQQIHWSAIDGPMNYGDSVTTQQADMSLSGYQNLADENGPITGFSSGDDLLIFKPRAIHRATGAPGPNMIIETVVVGSGTWFPNSITKYYGDTYYWGPDGPARIRAGASEPESLGLGKVSKTVTKAGFNTRTSDYVIGFYSSPLSTPSGYYTESSPVSFKQWEMSAFTDYSSGLVCWVRADGWRVTSSAGAAYAYPSVVLCYDVNTGTFSSFDVEEKFGFAKCINNSASFKTPPNSVGTESMYPANVLEGVYGIGLMDGVAYDGEMYIFTSYEDLGGALPGDIDYPSAYLTAPVASWSPQFIWPYNSLVNEKGQPVSTRIKRLRIPFSMLDNTTLPGDGTNTYKLVITAKIRSKNRPMDSYQEFTGTLDSSSTTWQDSGGWIDFPTATFMTYHQLEVSFSASKTGNNAQRYISHLSGLRYVEIEYETAGVSGGAYVT